MTGKWSKSKDAAALLELDDMSDDAEADGDFEDLETGEKHEGQKPNPEKEGGEEAGSKGKDKNREALLAKKQKLKMQFDAEYDDKGDNAYHEELKQMASQQAQVIGLDIR